MTGGPGTAGVGAGPRDPSLPGPAGRNNRTARAGRRGKQGSKKPREPQEHFALDPGLVRDPRLRTMLVLDVRALARARAAKDYRLSAVHLCSVCEAVVVDIALARRAEIELKGNPDAWRLDEVAKALLGERFTTGDRASLNHLIACRSLIQPSVQLQHPIVVTRATLATMIQFVQRLLIELGACGSGRAGAGTGTGTGTGSTTGDPSTPKK